MNTDNSMDKKEQVARLEAAAEAAPEDAALRFALGRARLAAGMAAEAADAFRKALELGCRDVECYVELSIAERLCGRDRPADRVLQDAWDKFPEDDSLPLLLYSAKMTRADYGAAASLMARAMSARPDNYLFRHARLQALLRDGKTAAADALLGEAETRFAEDKRFVYDKVESLLRHDAPGEALQLLQDRQSVCDPDGRMYLTLLSRCYTALKEPDKAEETLRKLYSLFPDDRTAVALAGLALQRKDYARVREDLAPVLARQDRSPEYLSARYLSASSRFLEDPAAGKEQLLAVIDENDAAVEADPRLFLPRLYNAGCYRLLGNPVRAAECEEYVSKMRRELEAQIDAL